MLQALDIRLPVTIQHIALTFYNERDEIFHTICWESFVAHGSWMNPRLNNLTVVYFLSIVSHIYTLITCGHSEQPTLSCVRKHTHKNFQRKILTFPRSQKERLLHASSKKMPAIAGHGVAVKLKCLWERYLASGSKSSTVQYLWLNAQIYWPILPTTGLTFTETKRFLDCEQGSVRDRKSGWRPAALKWLYLDQH